MLHIIYGKLLNSDADPEKIFRIRQKDAEPTGSGAATLVADQDDFLFFFGSNPDPTYLFVPLQKGFNTALPFILNPFQKVEDSQIGI
jgi:hypothetical protein